MPGWPAALTALTSCRLTCVPFFLFVDKLIRPVCCHLLQGLVLRRCSSCFVLRKQCSAFSTEMKRSGTTGSPAAAATGSSAVGAPRPPPAGAHPHPTPRIASILVMMSKPNFFRTVFDTSINNTYSSSGITRQKQYHRRPRGVNSSLQPPRLPLNQWTASYPHLRAQTLEWERLCLPRNGHSSFPAKLSDEHVNPAPESIAVPRRGPLEYLPGTVMSDLQWYRRVSMWISPISPCRNSVGRLPLASDEDLFLLYATPVGIQPTCPGTLFA